MQEPSEAEPDTGARSTSRHEDYDQQLTASWAEAHDQALRLGVDPEDAVRQADEAIEAIAAGHAEQYADALATDLGPHLNDVRSDNREFAERLHADWGEALDLYLTVVEVADSLSYKVLIRSREPGTRRLEPLMWVLSAMRGQALRGAREIHTLLSAGYPFGALGLARTLYEIAVRAIILTDHARLPGHEDLVERYLAHAKVAALKDARIYQRDAEELNYPPLSAEHIAHLESEVQTLKQFYDWKTYKHAYGWAAGLPGITSTRDITQLEALAGTTHRRGYYQWASHMVHADARGIHLSAIERGGMDAVVSNASNQELADPASHALWALRIVVECVVHASKQATTTDRITARALELLVAQADQAFVDAEDAVDAAEASLQENLATEGRRMTPWGLDNLPVREP